LLLETVSLLLAPANVAGRTLPPAERRLYYATPRTKVSQPEGESLPFVFKDAHGEVSFENTFAYDPASRTWGLAATRSPATEAWWTFHLLPRPAKLIRSSSTG